MTTFSLTSKVGALTLPVPAGSTNEVFSDPVVDALLDFLSWSLNNDLNAKLAKLTGTSATAVPTANQFAFDPFEPRGHSVKRPVPSLYVWWDGNSEEWQISHVLLGRQRNISALYIFQELPALTTMNIRRGLFNAVDASFRKAAQLEYHNSYAYNSLPDGTELEYTIGENLWDWKYIGGQGIQRIGIDEQTILPTLMRKSGRHYPAFAARFQVQEVVQEAQPIDPDNVLRDSPITIQHDGASILSRVFGSPDGDGAPEI